MKRKAKIKIILPGGKASPTPPVGPILGQYGINLNSFCKSFNDQTKTEPDLDFPTTIEIFENKEFCFKIGAPTTSSLIKKFTKNSIKKSLEKEDIDQIVLRKKEDLNTKDYAKAFNTIVGTIKSMKIKILQ